MDFTKVLESRRAVNFFDTTARLDEADIRAVYEAAKLAPSSFNLQPLKLLVVGDPENKKKLRECAFNQAKAEEASHVIVLLGDKKAYSEMDPILDDFISRGYFDEGMRETLKEMAKNLYSGENERAFTSRNAGIFAMAFMLAARDRGLATHPMDGFDSAQLREKFNIPDRYDIVMLIALGRHDESKPLLERAFRRSYDEVAVNETF